MRKSLKGELDLNFNMIEKTKTLKKIIIKILVILTLILQFSCNTEEYCYAEKGYKNLDGCYIILALYARTSDEKKVDFNTPLAVYTCIEQINIINECKNKPSKWPIPNEVLD